MPLWLASEQSINTLGNFVFAKCIRKKRGHVWPLFPHLHLAILNEPSEEKKTETPKGSKIAAAANGEIALA